MPTWLIAYQRRTGDLLRFEEFARPAAATGAQVRAKRERGGGWRHRDTEIVTITAASLETLRKYHGRYFARSDAGADEQSRLSCEIGASEPA